MIRDNEEVIQKLNEEIAKLDLTEFLIKLDSEIQSKITLE